MAKTLSLRVLSRGEQRVLAGKLKDLSLSARVHQRYRVIEQVRRGRAIAEASRGGSFHLKVARKRGQPQSAARLSVFALPAPRARNRSPSPRGDSQY